MNPIVPKEDLEQVPEDVSPYEHILQNYEHPERLKDSWPFELLRRVIAKARGE